MEFAGLEEITNSVGWVNWLKEISLGSVEGIRFCGLGELVEGDICGGMMESVTEGRFGGISELNCCSESDGCVKFRICELTGIEGTNSVEFLVLLGFPNRMGVSNLEFSN